MADLDTFDGVVDWVETEILPAIVENYQRNTGSFGIGLVTLEDDGSVLDAVTPRPIMPSDSTLSDEEDQLVFAEMTREVLDEYAAAGVIMVMFAPNTFFDDRVIVSLEHKGGRVNWISVGDAETLEPFERDDDYDWESEFRFSNMLPMNMVN